MDEPHSNIFVAGNYIASQTIGTQIIGGSHSHHYSSPDTRDTPYATRMAEDVEFEDVTPVETPTQAEAYPFVVAEKLAEPGVCQVLEEISGTWCARFRAIE